jgi:hypothetical protein
VQIYDLKEMKVLQCFPEEYIACKDFRYNTFATKRVILNDKEEKTTNFWIKIYDESGGCKS